MKLCTKYSCPNRLSLGSELNDDAVTFICKRCGDTLVTSRKSSQSILKLAITCIIIILSVLAIVRFPWEELRSQRQSKRSYQKELTQYDPNNTQFADRSIEQAYSDIYTSLRISIQMKDHDDVQSYIKKLDNLKEKYEIH